MIDDGIAYDENRCGVAALRRASPESLAASIPGASIELMEGCERVMFYEQPADSNRRSIRLLAAGRDGRCETIEPVSRGREAAA